jgi:chemotaxis protein CheX
MEEDPIQVLKDITTESTKAVFDAYGVELLQEDGDVNDASLMSVIGFTGADLRGTLVLAGEIGPFLAARTSDDLEVKDWAGEMANQLLGRIKNKMISYGAEVNMSTPLTVRGIQLNFGTSNESVMSLRFRAPSGCIKVCMDADLARGIKWEKTEEECPEEGDMMLF